MLIVLSAFIVEGLTNTRSVICILLFSLACAYYTHLVVQEKQAAIKKAELEKISKASAGMSPGKEDIVGGSGGASPNSKGAGGSYGSCAETTPLVTGNGQVMRPQGASSC
jgi:hypothetical protein